MWVKVERLIAPDGRMITHVEGAKGTRCEALMEGLVGAHDVIEQEGFTQEYYERAEASVDEAAVTREGP